ncbi:Vacuolar transporter chaperone 4 [Smittium culicis]|uniref:Vacuolar transporter chaperone 4 n=1 Tax=Smittium culicis TaxID=133412 RepID=A0A1R1WXR2_9FUNG|nr:Vacuolar transporter chaperone 4 [Smittium culicis]
MKFSEILKENVLHVWKFYYLDYDGLKEASRKFEIGNFTKEDEDEYISRLDGEIKKVESFQKDKITKIKENLDEIKITVDLLNKSRRPREIKVDQLRIIQEEIDAIISQVNELAKYTRINFTALVRLVKEHDKKVDFLSNPIFAQKVNNTTFFRESFDALLNELSGLYKIVRDNMRITSRDLNNEGESHKSMVVQKTSYWVYPENVMELKLYILKNIPVLLLRKNKNDKTSSSLTNVYFDNKNLDLYRDRIERIENSELIKIFWYGEEKKPDTFVEREKHSACHEGLKCVNEQFSIKEKHINSYLSGNFSPGDKELNGCKETPSNNVNGILPNEIIFNVKEKKLVPGKN